jgi:hypothetical protein
VRRVIRRQHLTTAVSAVSPESATAGIVGLRVRSGTAPFLSLLARVPGFERRHLEDALYRRHSLVRFRAMRGHVFIVRPSMLEVLFAATSPEILRYSRHNLEVRGVEVAEYERLAERILELTAERPLSTRQIREDLGTSADIGAVVTLMCDEGLLLRDRPAGSWRDLRMTYAPMEAILPEVRLGGMTRIDATVELLRAYIRGFGPVAYRDAVWWTGVGARRIDPALEILGDEVVRVSLAGSDDEHLIHAADVDELELVASGGARAITLVPCLDPYPMGYAVRDRYVSDADRPFVMDKSANTAPLILVDGVAVGVWDVGSDPDPEVLLHVFGQDYGDVHEAIEDRARAVGEFLFGSEPRVRFLDRPLPLPERGVGAFMRPLREPSG